MTGDWYLLMAIDEVGLTAKNQRNTEANHLNMTIIRFVIYASYNSVSLNQQPLTQCQD
jgi:hypothetical protein